MTETTDRHPGWTAEAVVADVARYVQAGLFTDRGIAERVRARAAQHPEREAAVDHDERVTYAELARQADEAAARLWHLGLRAGDNVLVQLPNCVGYLRVLFGCLRLGVRPVLMLMSHREQELDHIAGLTRARALLTVPHHLGHDHGAMAHRVGARHPELQVVLSHWRNGMYPGTDGGSAPLTGQASGADIALFLLSGGTTATPKVIPKVHAAYAYNATASAARCEVSENDTYLAVLSTSHDYALCSPGVLGTLVNGGRVVMAKTSSFDEVSMWLEDEDITFTQAVPALAAIWLQQASDGGWGGPADWQIPKLILGAARLEWELAQRLHDVFGSTIVQGYGLGEGVTCFTSPHDPPHIAWTTQGTPVCELDELRIVDDSGQPVEPGTVGELVERGPYTAYGYYRAPALTRKTFDAQGFLHTGDAARLRPDGRLVIVGRTREQINRGGENVVPSEVESLVARHPDIKEVVVVGLPDPVLGEATWAVVVAHPGAVAPSRVELCRFLAALGVAAYKHPDRLVTRNTLPYKNIGKVDKDLLRHELRAGEQNEA